MNWDLFKKWFVEMLLEKINDHSVIHKPYIAKYSLELGDSCVPLCKS